LSLLWLVVRVQCLDFDNYDITWDLPIPTRSVVVTTEASEVTTATYLSAPTVVLTTDNIDQATELFTPQSTTVIETTNPVKLLTTTLATFTDNTTLFSNSDNFVKSVKASDSVTTYSPAVVPNNNNFSLTISPLGNALNKRNVFGGTFDDNLAELYGLESELSSGDNLLISSTTILSNVSLEEIEYEILNLENEVKNLNTSQNSTSEPNLAVDNIWTQTATFLATSDGLAFTVTIVFLGQQQFLHKNYKNYKKLFAKFLTGFFLKFFQGQFYFWPDRRLYSTKIMELDPVTCLFTG